MVRGITRPMGESFEQARATYQAGEVGGKLGEASKLIAGHDSELNMLTGGAERLADSLGGIRGQVGQTVAMVSVLVDTLSSMLHQVGGQKTLNDINNAAQLISGIHGLGDAIGVSMVDNLKWLDPVLAALDSSPVCSADPDCSNLRVQLQRLATARNDGTFDKIVDLGRKLRSARATQSLDSLVTSLRTALSTATNALQSLGGDLRGQLAKLQKGADALADGSRQLADGVELLVDQVKQMGGGLSEASAFLLAMKSEAKRPSMAGFYIPRQALTSEEFKQAAGAFISSDGRVARYLVQTELNPFSTAAMDQVNAIVAAARGAQPNTALADAKISMAGLTVGLRDTRDYYDRDLNFFVLATIIIVFLILVVLLRALIAALYLIISVVISYTSALGIGVIVFQLVLGQELHWSVPGLTFVLLVAMGADYNLLLISRIRDSSRHGLRLSVIRTVGSTGGVITSAGLIFAASMFGLMFASFSTLVQAGFVVGVGILLDTFLVRTITVPTVAVLVGQANWWPHQWWPRLYSPARLKRRSSRSRQLVGDAFRRPEDSHAGVSQARQAVLSAITTERESDEPPPCHALPQFGPSSSPETIERQPFEAHIKQLESDR